MWERVCASCSSPGPVFCGRCRAFGRARRLRKRPSLTEEAWAAFSYEDGVGAAVVRAKHTPDRALALHLGAAFSPIMRRDIHVLALLQAATCVTWVPSPWNRDLARGFSLAGILAFELGRDIVAPVRPLLHVRRGAPQARGDRAARHVNLRGRVRGEKPIQGLIVLVDDVVTTGSTASAAARELLGAGAERVVLLTLCAAGDVFAVPDLPVSSCRDPPWA